MKSKTILTLAFFTLSFGNNLNAGVLAEKKGPFEKYDKCTLSEYSGSLELKLNRHYHLIQTTKYENPFEDLTHSFSLAIDSAKPPRRRWFPTQINYYLRGESGKLSRFYAFGYENIENEAHEAKVLINQIDAICDFQLEDFSILGRFKLDLKIGDKNFEDVLIIKRNHTEFGAQISGTYIVPNSFEAKIKDLKFIDGKFSFKIRVREGSDDYEAIFEGFLNSEDELSGSGYILPSRKLLGHFTGNRL